MITKNTRRLSSLAIALLSLSCWLATFGPMQVQADDLANPAFSQAYNANPGLWGAPGQVLNEEYAGVPNNSRQVQYFQKGRMEATRPNSAPGFVGDGKIVVEMVAGWVQVGDTEYRQFNGAEIPVAGGTTFATNPSAPSYRAFASLTGATASRVGRPVTAVLNAPQGEGFLLSINSLSTDPALGTLARYAAYIPESGHNVPDVFWKYLNQNDANGLPLFNWQSVFGLPITDSYWAKVRDASGPHDVLVQLFERRTLLYDPAAVPGQQVDSGPVGRDYYQWRYRLPELPVIDDSFTPPNTTPNAQVRPAIGEAGTTFVVSVSGFQAHETLNLYLRVSPDGGVYSQRTFQTNGEGKLVIRGRTQPLTTPTSEYYLTFTGQSSGQTALVHYKVIGSVRYTPAVEAIQPSDVPLALNSTFDQAVLRVGGVGHLNAGGFGPSEYLKGWITTPLNRVVGWVGLVNSASVAKQYPYLLRADSAGNFKLEVPMPGEPEPGIYAFTVYGPTSQRTAIVYFRVRAGPAVLFDPTWGEFDFDVQPRRSNHAPVDVFSLAQHAEQYRQTQPTIQFEQAD